MSPTDKCPQCGTPLKNPALGGLCPACLLVQGAADTVTDAKQPPFHPPSIAELAPLFPQLEILELIGKGGMGAVYKARQKELDRIVALKILPPGIGDAPGFAERFTREAKALAKLNHPNIVTLYEFGRVQSGTGVSPVSSDPSTAHTGETPVPLYFFLMEYVDGVNLRQLLDTGRVSSREALAIVPQICDALQFAHDHGIVHRDIKPENILLDRRGRVKVADFGLAKIVGTDGGAEVTLGQDGPQRVTTNSLTDAGKVMGTPSYMAPEQVSHPADVDHRADIYALGVVFYQMLTGELPGKRIEPPSKKVQIDVRLDEIVLRALETKPELRYQQASVLKTQVETIAGTPTSGDSVTAPTRPETASAPESVNFPRPWPLTIVAALFILSGCFSVWEVVTGLQRDVYNLNLGVLGLPIGVGLLRRRPWWRRTGLAAVWLAFAISLVFGGLALAGQIHFLEHASVKFFGRELTGPARWPAAILAGALGIALFVWIYRVLIRPDLKKLFRGGGFNRLWIEWSVLVGTFVFLGGISWLTKNESVTALSATNLTFGPVIERVIPTSRRDEACVLDFESGELLTPPDDLAEKIAKNLQAITGDDQSWMSANSADAAVRTRANNYSLMIFECATVSVDETGSALVWEELTPAKLTAALAPARSFFGHGFFYSDVLSSKTGAGVFGFITRERGLGVLQITGFTDNPRGVKLRYKLVQNIASNVASRVGEKAVGSLRLIAGGPHENLAIARKESVIGFSLHEVVARFGGPALTQEQWRLARGVASGPTLAPSTSETMKDDWLPEPVNSMGIWNDYENPTNRQPSSCWFACPNECQLQFALTDKTEAAEASRQMNAAFSKPVPLIFGERIPLFRVGEREAWLEVRKIHPPAGKLAFINSHLHNAGDVPVAGRSPVQPLGTNRVDSAAITIPPNATLTFTGYAQGKTSETNVFSTTLTNNFNQPGLYWLTWRAGSSSSAEADGWEILIHDARTTQELGHFVSHEPMRFKWRADWSYESTTVEPGETMEKVLLVNDGMTQPGNSRIPFSLLRIKITMQPLVETQKK